MHFVTYYGVKDLERLEKQNRQSNSENNFKTYAAKCTVKKHKNKKGKK